MAEGKDDTLNRFEELAIPLFDSLFNFAHWLTKDHDEAEDLVQEAFLKAWKGFGSFQPGTNFRAWLFRILRNSFLTSRTGLAARMTVPIEDEEETHRVPTSTETPETNLIERAGIERVRQAIEELPLPYREVLLLCDVEELTYHEISEALSIPIGTVMSRLARARKKLREALSEGQRGDSAKRKEAGYGLR